MHIMRASGFTLLALMSLVLTTLNSPVHGMTAPSEIIRNQAELTYFDPLEGQVFRVLSNVSQVMVSQREAVKLDADKQINGAPGQQVNIAHRLTNTGNQPDSYRLLLGSQSDDYRFLSENLKEDIGDLKDVAVYIDTNGNGIADPGEPAVTRLPQLMPGESIDLVIAGSVPSTAAYGSELGVNMKILSETNGEVSDTIEDTIHIRDGAVVVLNKQSSEICTRPVSPGQTLVYDLSFTNAGNRVPESRTFRVDGGERQGVLIEDPIPANTRLLPGASLPKAPFQSELLVHRAGDPADEWIRYDRWDGETLDLIGLLVPAAQMQPNQSGKFSFKVQVNANVTQGSVLLNTARLDYGGSGQVDERSNTVCNTLEDTGVMPAITFQRPSNDVFRRDGVPAHGNDADFTDTEFYRLLPDGTPGVLEYGVYLRLNASQLNLSGSLQDYAFTSEDGETLYKTTVTSRLTGDSVEMVMQETGPNTGVFRSVYPLLLSNNLKGEGGQCPADATLNEVNRFGPDTSTEEVIAQGCVLNSAPNDRLDAVFQMPSYWPDGSQATTRRVTDQAAVSPYGTVFNSATGEPVSGATVTLFQSRAPLGEGESCASLPRSAYRPARSAYSDRPIEPEITDASHADSITETGRYQFPEAAPGYCYYLDVTPPEGFTFASELPIFAARQFYGNVTEASYGFNGLGGPLGDTPQQASYDVDGKGAFALKALASFVDIPLDPEMSGEFTLTKTVDSDTASVADVVSYQIEISNNDTLDNTLYNAIVVDSPAYGFRYIPDSAYLEADDERIEIPEPTGDTGSALSFRLQRDGAENLSVFRLEPGETATLNYAMRLSAGALDSDGVNRAVATASTRSGFTYTSNQDEAKVEVRTEGVLSDRAILFGKVYVDSNCNNHQDNAEWPIGGVKLYLQDGTWVITDENGQFSIHGLRPDLNTLKVDPLTLPEGLVLKPIDNRHAADGQSRFVDLRPGEMHRADFAAACPPPGQLKSLKQQLTERNESITGSWMFDDTVRYNPLTDSNPKSRRDQPDSSGGLGTGVYTQSGMLDSVEEAEQRFAASGQAGQPRTEQQDKPHAQMQDTERVAAGITREQAKQGTWLWPRDGFSNDGRLQVVIPAGLTPSLWVNGEPVGDGFLGEQILNRRERAAVVSWYGVPLTEGDNRIEVKAEDAFGNQRELAATDIIRPAAAASLSLAPAASTLAADGGRSTLPVRVLVKDANGHPASGVHFVTLENTRGSWAEADLQPDTPGFQVRVRRGEAVVNLRSSELTGPVELTATLNEMSARADIDQIAPMRPLVATGFIQGRNTFAERSGNGEPPTDPASDVPQDGLDKRATAFLKGGIRGDMHLTLAYDSENQLDEEDEIRRDLNPADHYALAGDSSVRGYEARSASKLYAKLEKDRNSLMWGDYRTDANASNNDLGRVQRTLTGINGVLENDRTRLQLFGAESDYDQISEELDGNGTAMLFTLANRPRRDSETLELVVRDRNNPGLVISSRSLRRHEDYTVNYFTGDIRFYDVIPSVDEDNNPVSIRANYEPDQADAETHTIVGARLSHHFTDELELILSHTQDRHASNGYRLSSATAEFELTNRDTFFASIATMENTEDDSEGQAASVGIKRQWTQGTSTEARYARAEEGFRNSAGGITENREEARLTHRQRMTDNLNTTLEAIHSNQLDSPRQESSLGLTAELKLGKNRLTAGARRIEQRDKDGRERFTTAIVGAQRNLSLVNLPLSLGVEYEQVLNDPDRMRLAADAELGITDNTRLYAGYEAKNSLSGINQLDSNVDNQRLTLGVRSDITDSTNVFSEYRLEGAQGDRDATVATGVRSHLEVEEGLSVSPSLEWVNAVDRGSDASQESVAVSVAVEDVRDDDRRTLARLETRVSDDRTYYGATAANVWRLNRDWSGVVRNDLRLQDVDGKPREGDNIVTLGLARRPLLNNRLHSLYMYKWKEKWGGDTGSDNTLHLLSTHQNYQAGDDWILSGRLGGKWQTTELGSLDVTTDAYIANSRLIWDLNRRFDIDLNAGVLATNGGDEVRYSYGLGLNALVRRNLRVGIGYNVAGFSDTDLDPQGYNAKGLFLGFEFKFDESSLGWLGATAAEQRSYMGESK